MRRKIALYRRKWAFLAPSERATRVRSLEALRLMKEGKSLYNASELVGIDPRTTKAHLGRYLFKRQGRWRNRKSDRIQRGLTIYERGRIRAIVVGDNETATLIGQYMNDVKKVLYGYEDPSGLKKYRKLRIKDVDGKKHTLETRLEKLKEIELGREDTEFSDIYAY